ncbi:a-Factor sex pheromone exporter [Cordyceps militaris]|uniref:A-Factor sex pheromone exporter n=1 Tax=Cordyceps militaris TaxID=73501 RepID=A0A2H4S5F5_CORMI|nr:a-Factor sex pheromone exporter [Cordyceps militaris]
MKKNESDTDPTDGPTSVTVLLNEPPKWRHLFAFTTRQHLYYLSAAVLSSAGAAALRTSLAVVLGKIFDIVAAAGGGGVAESRALPLVSRYCLVLVGMGAAQWTINSAFLGLWLMFGELQAKSVRNALFTGLTKMERAWIDSLPHGTTGLVASIQRKTHELQMATSQVFGYLVADIFTTLASLAIALQSSWKLTLVLLATVPPSIVVLALTNRKIPPAIMCNGYASELQNYIAHTDRAAKHYRIQALNNSIQIGYSTFWAVAMFVVGFWYGLVLVQQGERPGNILTTFYAVLTTLQGVESMLPNWLVFQRGMSAGQVLQALKVEVAEASEDDPNTVRPGYFVGAIDMEEVSFAYPTAPTVKCLDKCTISIPAGELTFLVGRSGSGKSTVASLASRTYDTTSGSIFMDGVPINKLEKKWMQRHVMLVDQTPVIFKDTLFQNVVFGHPDPASATHQEVLQACYKFGLESAIATLSAGIHTVVGGEGCPLSGGQRQRVALARAYLRDPVVLFLDEPTSALDPNSREMIMNEIREWRRRKTTVIISHDIDSIRHSDFMYVLEKGIVVRSGFKRNLESADMGIFSTASLDEAAEESSAHINMDLIPPYAAAAKPLRGHRPPTMYNHAWFTSGNNSFRHSSPSRRVTSLLSPRLSVLSVRSVNLGSSAATPRLSSLITSKQGRPMSSPGPDTTSLQPPCSSSRRDLDTMSNASEASQSPKKREKKRRSIVDLGWKRRHAKEMSFASILSTIMPALDGLRTAYLVLGVGATMIGALTTPAFSFCLAKLLAVMWSAGDKHAEGRQWALYLFIVAVVDGVCTGLGRYLLESSAQSWVDSIRRSALQRILRQPKSWFTDNADTNSQACITETFNVHAEEMRNLVGRFLPNIIAVATMITASVVWALAVRWDLSLVALAPLPLVVVVLQAYTRASKAWEARCADAAEQAGQGLAEVLAAGRTVANCGLQDHFAAQFAQAAFRCLSLGARRALRTCPLFGLYQAFSYALTSLAFYYGTRLLTGHSGGGVVDADAVLQVLNLLLFSFGTATELLGTMPQITVTTAAAARVLAYTQLPDGELPSDSGDVHGGIPAVLPVCMRDLSFAYPGRAADPTLAGVTLDIPPAGALLLLGLHRPTSPASSLCYADTPGTALDPRQLRAAIGYVPQTPFLFPGSIADNIAYGLAAQSPLRHRANIRAAARDAGIDDFIQSLPASYDTLVGDSGITLSGGQAQRVTVARALVRHPALLVMDEPTSALDPDSTAAVGACVVALVARWRAERRSAAVVVATHNVEMMRVADVVVVVEDGRVVEQGAFEDLWFSGDAFRRLVRQNQDD